MTIPDAANSHSLTRHPDDEALNFLRWFSGSKITDETGRPLLVFHGTPSDFSTFADQDGGEGMGSGMGHFFTPDKNVALNYAPSGNVLSAYLLIKNPLVINDYYGIDTVARIAFDYVAKKKYGKTSDELENSDSQSDQKKSLKLYDYFGGKMDEQYMIRKNRMIRSVLSEMGYDGIMLIGDKQSATATDVVLVAFSSQQIKLSTGTMEPLKTPSESASGPTLACQQGSITIPSPSVLKTLDDDLRLTTAPRHPAAPSPL